MTAVERRGRWSGRHPHCPVRRKCCFSSASRGPRGRRREGPRPTCWCRPGLG